MSSAKCTGSLESVCDAEGGLLGVPGKLVSLVTEPGALRMTDINGLPLMRPSIGSKFGIGGGLAELPDPSVFTTAGGEVELDASRLGANGAVGVPAADRLPPELTDEGGSSSSCPLRIRIIAESSACTFFKT